MRYVDFLKCLFEDGRVTVPVPTTPLDDEELREADELTAGYERVHRTQVPGEAPEFLASAARWSATRFFRACQCAVYRDLGEEVLNAELGIPFDGPATPSAHYSVDLVFRYLPDLTRFAQSAAERDPLVLHLHRWGQSWPLSSVGTIGIDEVSIEGFASSDSLMRLYVDRVIKNHDESRMSDRRVRDGVEAALGMFADLDERMSSAVKHLRKEEASH